jgi:hypothetical protein
MPYTSCELDGLIVIRWSPNKPAVADIVGYASEIAAARERQGRPLVAIFIMPPDHGNPDEAFRKAQAQRLPKIMAHLEFAVAVFEGSGFVASLKRSALVAILLLAPRRHHVYVRASVEDALIHNPPKELAFEAKEAIAELKRLGFVAQQPDGLSRRTA